MDSGHRTKCIVIEGLISAGKSTFLNVIREKCPDIFIVEEPVSLFQTYKIHNPLSELRNTPFATQCHIMNVLKDYYTNLSSAMKQHSIVVMERFPQSPLIFAQALLNNKHMTQFEYDLFVEMFKDKMKSLDLPDIDGIYYLPVSPAVCMQRLISRNRIEEQGFVTQGYLKELEQAYENYFKEHTEIALWYAIHDTIDNKLQLEEFLSFVSYV